MENIEAQSFGTKPKTADRFFDAIAETIGTSRKVIKITLGVLVAALGADLMNKGAFNQQPYPNYKASLPIAGGYPTPEEAEIVLADAQANKGLECLRERFYSMVKTADGEVAARCGDTYYDYKTLQDIVDARKTLLANNGLPTNLESWLVIPTVTGPAVKFNIDEQAFKNLTPEQREKLKNAGILDDYLSR